MRATTLVSRSTRRLADAALASALAFTLALAGCAAPRAPAGSAGTQRPAIPQERPVAAPDAKAIDAETATILGGRHLPIPALQQVQPDRQGRVVEISTRNDTPYPLVLLYSGPTSQRLRLAPGASGDLRVEVGEYAVAARVETTANIPPYAGRQRLDAGRFASRWYIETVKR